MVKIWGSAHASDPHKEFGKVIFKHLGKLLADGDIKVSSDLTGTSLVLSILISFRLVAEQI